MLLLLLTFSPPPLNTDWEKLLIIPSPSVTMKTLDEPYLVLKAQEFCSLFQVTFSVLIISLGSTWTCWGLVSIRSDTPMQILLSLLFRWEKWDNISESIFPTAIKLEINPTGLLPNSAFKHQDLGVCPEGGFVAEAFSPKSSPERSCFLSTPGPMGASE